MKSTAYVGLTVAITFLMGVAFPVGKMGMLYATPFLLMGIRFVLAGGLLAVLTAKKRQPKGLKQWLQTTVIGLFQSAGVMGCAYYSMHWISSGESSIITCANPMLVVILSTIFTGARYRAGQWLGAAIGFAGVIFSFGAQVVLQPGTFIGFAGAVSFATATMLIKQWGGRFDMNVLAAYQMIFGGIILLGLSVLTEHPHIKVNTMLAVVLLWLIIMGSIVQFTGWFYLLKHGDPGKVSSYLFLVPIFGVWSSRILLGEKVAWQVIAGGMLVCVGIYMVNRVQPSKSSLGTNTKPSAAI